MSEPTAQGQPFYADPDALAEARAAEAARVAPATPSAGVPVAPTPGPAGASPRQAPAAAVKDDRPDAEDVLKSMDGWEEIAVEQMFGKDIIDLASVNRLKLARALLFVLKRRDGLHDGDAFKAAMAANIADLDSYFAPEDDEPAVSVDGLDVDQALQAVQSRPEA